MPRYKWESAQGWLQDKLEGLGEDALLEYAKAMARVLDGDQIQDVFQQDMDHDGFFKDLDALTCRECDQTMIVGPHALEESDGVTHHLTDDGGIDHDQDADHVAIAEEE